MSHPDAKLPIIYLKPAEIHIADGPSIVKTVLGSCVSVTLFSRRLQAGAICHGLLPQCRERNGCTGECGESFRYVACSLAYMLRQFRSWGIERREIEVKIFGGANMFIAGRGERETVGVQNIKAALGIIKGERLNLRNSDIGGSQGRKIFFYTHTGEVFLKRLGTDERELIADVMKAEHQMRLAAGEKRCQGRADDSLRLVRRSTPVEAGSECIPRGLPGKRAHAKRK